jgi:biotin carboxyl carrier protein
MKKKFLAIVNGEEVEFHFEKKSDGAGVLTFGDKTFDFDIASVGAKTYSLLHGGKSETVSLASEGEALRVAARGQSVTLKLLDEKKLRRAGGAAGAAAQASGDVVSPMPGKVVKIQVTEGQTVKAGDGVIVVEAMKMENEFKAPRDGVVKSLKVKVGDSVEGGAILVVVA